MFITCTGPSLISSQKGSGLAMEHKAWRWSRRTTEKTIIANGRAVQTVMQGEGDVVGSACLRVLILSISVTAG